LWQTSGTYTWWLEMLAIDLFRSQNTSSRVSFVFVQGLVHLCWHFVFCAVSAFFWVKFLARTVNTRQSSSRWWTESPAENSNKKCLTLLFASWRNTMKLVVVFPTARIGSYWISYNLQNELLAIYNFLYDQYLCTLSIKVFDILSCISFYFWQVGTIHSCLFVCLNVTHKKNEWTNTSAAHFSSWIWYIGG